MSPIRLGRYLTLQNVTHDFTMFSLLCMYVYVCMCVVYSIKMLDLEWAENVELDVMLQWLEHTPGPLA